MHPSLSWFSPFAIDGGTAALTSGVLLAVFIYWGWDSAVSVNEETEDPTEAPGKSAVISTILLVGIYMLVATAALAFAGTEALADQDDALSILGTDVLGNTFDSLLIIAVLTSAAASTQTTILPTARTALSMARSGALPARARRRAPALHDAARLDDPVRRAVDRLVRRADDRQREHPLRLDRGARPDDLLLLRADRLRLRDLLPPRGPQVAQGAAVRGHRAGRGRRDADVHPREVDHRPVRPGELGIGRLVVRPRSAARHRHRLHAARRRADALVEPQPPHVLRAEGAGLRAPSSAPEARFRAPLRWTR